MKRRLSFCLLLACGTACLAAGQCPTVSLPGLAQGGCIPAAFALKRNDGLSSEYPDTRCVSFSLSASGENVGFLCSSTNGDWLHDYGIARDGGGSSAGGASLAETFTVATGMTSYRMEPVELERSIGKIYGADVDCDRENGPVYRATATCHVAISLLPDGRFLYSIFLLKDHVSAKQEARKSDVISLWKSLKTSP